jgi:hypothetical protein
VFTTYCQQAFCNSGNSTGIVGTHLNICFCLLISRCQFHRHHLQCPLISRLFEKLDTVNNLNCHLQLLRIFRYCTGTIIIWLSSFLVKKQYLLHDAFVFGKPGLGQYVWNRVALSENGWKLVSLCQTSLFCMEINQGWKKPV